MRRGESAFPGLPKAGRQRSAGSDAPEGFHGEGRGADVVDAENLGAAQHAGGQAGDGARVALGGVGLIEHLADDRLA